MANVRRWTRWAWSGLGAHALSIVAAVACALGAALSHEAPEPVRVPVATEAPAIGGESLAGELWGDLEIRLDEPWGERHALSGDGPWTIRGFTVRGVPNGAPWSEDDLGVRVPVAELVAER